MHPIKRFLEPLKSHTSVYLKSAGVYFLWGLNGIVHVIFLQLLTSGLEKNDQEIFLRYIFAYIFYLAISQIVLFLVEKYSWPRVAIQTENFVQKKYLRQFVELDNNAIENIGTGKMVSIIMGGIQSWGRLLSLLVGFFPQMLTSFLFTLVMILFIEPLYTLIFLVLYFFGFVIANYFNKKAVYWRKKRVDEKAFYTKDFVKILMSKYEILQSEKIENELDTLEVYQENMVHYNEKMSRPMGNTFRIPELGVDILLLFVFYFFGKQVFAGELALSTFVGISGVIILMKNSVKQAIDLYRDFGKVFTQVEKLWELFDNTSMLPGYSEGKIFRIKNGDIRIKNLSFSYGESRETIFDDFSLHLKGRSVSAFVGASGSGKSTLLKIIAGYMYPKSGEVIVDNQKLSEVQLKSYYKHIGYLTQDPSVFDGTIYDNLIYGVTEMQDMNKIEKIIQLAKCEFIYDYEKGLDTQVGERGIKLSGGQKQRLAIAKIMLRNPEIILLDEPTSALDSFSEEAITEAMENLFQNRTVIIIAHRLQTVKRADRIFVFENGSVVESGNHTDLVQKNGVYKKLLELQSGV